MKILVVEDDVKRQVFFLKELIGNDVHLASTYEEAVELLTNNIFDLIYLDHDLQDEHYHDQWELEGERTSEENKNFEGTGYSIAKWMTKHNNNITARIIVHSLNPVGARNIYLELKYCKYNVLTVSYFQLRQNAKKDVN